MILPFEAIAVPLFYMLADYRNTYPVQFLPFIAIAFSIYLFDTFFVGLPKQIEEAARVAPDAALLLETDAPYLLPRDLTLEQLGGRKVHRNEPRWLPHVARGEAMTRRI